MKDSSKSIYNVYLENTILNNTTNNNDSYLYSPREYVAVKNEYEEGNSKLKINQLFKSCFDLSKSGSKEDYKKIMLNMTKLTALVKQQILT